jgi:Xaa-Pro aminopeptidase
MTVIAAVKEFFHSFNLARVADSAEKTKASALHSVAAAEAHLRSTRRTAVSTLKTEEETVVKAIVTADSLEAEREKTRAAELAETAKKGDAEIEALIKALELAQRNATKALEDLRKEHNLEREVAAEVKKAAIKALEDVASAKAAIEAALKG